ncbi:unnamed protein product [Caenorhabditis angaria]|uniref:Transforming acidic coiled-coil-containing protein C-terminal domain-containing protein n=1 Tax=Caenorhabditis angaria TaxID=860376 RepID=A0A9P1ITV6_9PELO|nr:unnamed protein product [Caenorhabditis angaria]
MNTTFNRDDESAPSSPIAKMAPNDIPPTMSAPANNTIVMSVEESNGNVEIDENDAILAGCSLMDVVILKHTNKKYMEINKRLFDSDEFEVRRCSDGQVISYGRCSNFGLPGSTPSNSIPDEEYQRIVKERDQARQEAEKSHENYNVLFSSYTAVREAANDIREGYQEAAEKLKMAAGEVEEWKTKYEIVKQNANLELERASLEYEDLVRNHEENTKGLRLKVKRAEIEMKSRDDEIHILKSRIEELTRICDQLMNDVDVTDTESRYSASYDA